MPALSFRIIGPDGTTGEFPIADGLTIGRSESCSITLNDPKASGNHARVVADGDALFIEDMGSSNHTLIHNGPILEEGQKHPLAPGTALQIGDTKIVVIVVGESGGGANKTVMASRQDFGQLQEDSETLAPGEDGKLKSLAEVAAFKTARPRLVICNEAIRRIDDVDQVSWLVGRSDESANCVIEHQSVSGSHARIVFSNRRFFIEDLGSRNGTYVNGEKLAPSSRMPLEPESSLRFGGVEALFVLDTDKEGRNLDAKPYEKAVDYLVHEGTITRLQAEEVIHAAAEQKRHPGEILLVKGYVRVDQWKDALKKGDLVVVRNVVANSGGGLKGLLILVAALLLVLVILLLVKPDLLKSLFGGG